jgi:serine/threonine protein kinase
VYTEAEARFHIRTIIKAVQFMHDQGVVHRDLKPENILLSDKTANAQVLVADFGLGRFVSSADQKMDTVCGTHHYLAPELVKCDRGELETYDKAVDVWGIGLIAFIMLFGYNPFLRDSNMATHEAIVTCKYSFPKDDNISKHAKDMIKKMLLIDHKKRMTLPQALDHQFLLGEGEGDALSVNQHGVRSVMKEFNARRAVMKLTGMRGKSRRARGPRDPTRRRAPLSPSILPRGPVAAAPQLVRRAAALHAPAGPFISASSRLGWQA